MEQKNNADDIANAWVILIGSVFILGILLFVVQRDTQPYFKGKVVNAVVSGRDCGFKTNWLYLTYQEQEYSLSVGREKCRNSVVGEVISVRLLQGVRRVYYPDENPFIWLVGGYVWVVLSIVYALRTLYKSRH